MDNTIRMKVRDYERLVGHKTTRTRLFGTIKLQRLGQTDHGPNGTFFVRFYMKGFWFILLYPVWLLCQLFYDIWNNGLSEFSPPNRLGSAFVIDISSDRYRDFDKYWTEKVGEWKT